jgi:hypothetical protein
VAKDSEPPCTECAEPVIAYKGCGIGFESYVSSEGWRAGARVTLATRGQVQTHKVADFMGATFSSKTDADDRAFLLAKQWIDVTVQYIPS